MSDTFDELQKVRAETAELERQTRDARYRIAVIAEATERRLDAATTLDLVTPEMFVLADDGTPRNVKEILDRLHPQLAAVTEHKAAVAAAAATPRLGEGPLKGGARMERAVTRSRRVGGRWVSS